MENDYRLSSYKKRQLSLTGLSLATCLQIISNAKCRLNEDDAPTSNTSSRATRYNEGLLSNQMPKPCGVVAYTRHRK